MKTAFRNLAAGIVMITAFAGLNANAQEVHSGFDYVCVYRSSGMVGVADVRVFFNLDEYDSPLDGRIEYWFGGKLANRIRIPRQAIRHLQVDTSADGAEMRLDAWIDSSTIHLNVHYVGNDFSMDTFDELQTRMVSADEIAQVYRRQLAAGEIQHRMPRGVYPEQELEGTVQANGLSNNLRSSKFVCGSIE